MNYERMILVCEKTTASHCEQLCLSWEVWFMYGLHTITTVLSSRWWNGGDRWQFGLTCQAGWLLWRTAAAWHCYTFSKDSCHCLRLQWINILGVPEKPTRYSFLHYFCNYQEFWGQKFFTVVPLHWGKNREFVCKQNESDVKIQPNNAEQK